MAKRGFLDRIDEDKHIVNIEGTDYPVAEAAWNFVPKETGVEVDYDINNNGELRYIKVLGRSFKGKPKTAFDKKAEKFWKPRDPEETKSIEKQVCLKAAVDVCVAEIQNLNHLPKANSINDVLDKAEHFWKWMRDISD